MSTPKLTLHRGEDYVAIMRPDETTDTALVLVRHPDDEGVRVLTVMAASGDMLDALHDILRLAQRDTPTAFADVVQAARAAIAKAEKN